MNIVFSPRTQLVLAWIIFAVSIVAWPVTAVTVFSTEPQGILGLSWFAIVLGAWNTIVTTQVNKDIGE
jgi:hypothetical protein